MGLEISGQKEKRNLKTVFLSSFSLVILVRFLSPCVTLVMSQQEVIHPNWEALFRNKLCFHVKKNSFREIRMYFKHTTQCFTLSMQKNKTILNTFIF